MKLTSANEENTLTLAASNTRSYVKACRGKDNCATLQPGADIATHLARHGLAVRVVAVPSLGEPPEVALLRHAVQSGADLVVAGGYSRARWRETLFGGATRTLLESAPMPVLFSR